MFDGANLVGVEFGEMRGAHKKSRPGWKCSSPDGEAQAIRLLGT
jgi:hypothetical protein